ncbi:MAG: hypothetical protein EOO40_10270 [Deltaproteobacteria bacterium]|nr:MAG: hypothetical protein EOO40_10270 [Deltaproteobacteria bacterium]
MAGNVKNVLLNGLMAASSSLALDANGSLGNSYINISATNAASYGIRTSVGALGDHFRGLCQVGAAGVADCSAPIVSGSGIQTASGAGACLNDPLSSDATINGGQNGADYFVGVVTSDAYNSSQVAGQSGYGSITDWVNFENPYRTWGIYAATMLDASARNACISGTCRIYDWRLSANNNSVRNVLPTKVFSHTFSSGATAIFLGNAVEVLNDGIGNDNGLCEAGEACILSPNIGRYQGHGSLINLGTLAVGAGSATLQAYSVNGG